MNGSKSCGGAREAGFTLVEVLVVAVVMAIGLLGGLALLLSGLRASKVA
jgi:type IV pilus assembly protein PilV